MAKPLKHGHTSGGRKTKAYIRWESMKARCLRPSHDEYHRYGGRGILICERWLVFENFYADTGDAPPGMSIDRYPDNNGNYEPGNWRWATSAQQLRNQRKTKLITFNGETMCMKDWAVTVGLQQTTLWRRFDRGWPTEKALTTPANMSRGERK